MADLIEQKEAESELSNTAALAALAEAGDAGARTADVEARTGLTAKTTSRALARLKTAKLATREGDRGRWFITAAGRVQAGAGVPGLGVGPALSAAVELLPTEAHKAFARLLVSAVIARHHLLADYPDGWCGFVTLGPTGTGKTTLAHFVCDAFGLDHVRAIRLVATETPAALLGSRFQEEGGRRGFDPSPLLAEPFLCLDELDKAKAESKAAALKLLQGDAAAELEGHRFEVRPTVMVCLNARPDQLAGLVGEAYVRRSVVLDTTPLKPLLDGVATVVRRLRRPGTVPRLELSRLAPPIRELPEERWQQLNAILAAELVPAGRALVDVEALSRCALGRASLIGGGDLKLAVAATAFDYLTTAATLDHTREGYAQRLRAELGGEALLPDAGAVEVEGHHRQLAVRDGRQHDLNEQLVLVAVREGLTAQVERARKPLLGQPDPEVRGVARALKRILEALAVCKTAAALEDIRATAAPWIEWAERWKAARDDEASRAAEQARQDKQLKADLARQRKEQAAAIARRRSQSAKAAAARRSALQKLYNRVDARGQDVVATLVDHQVIAFRQEQYQREVPPPVVRNWWRRKTGAPELGPTASVGTRSWYEDSLGRRYERAELVDYGMPGVRAAIEAAAASEGLRLAAAPSRKPRSSPRAKAPALSVVGGTPRKKAPPRRAG